MNTALRIGALCWELIYRLRPTLDARKQTVLLQCKKKSLLRRQRLEILGNQCVYGRKKVLCIWEQIFLHRFVVEIAFKQCTFQGI